MGCTVQAADMRQQALHAVQRDRRVQAHLGRDISLGPGGCVAGLSHHVACRQPQVSALQEECFEVFTAHPKHTCTPSQPHLPLLSRHNAAAFAPYPLSKLTASDLLQLFHIYLQLLGEWTVRHDHHSAVLCGQLKRPPGARQRAGNHQRRQWLKHLCAGVTLLVFPVLAIACASFKSLLIMKHPRN